MGKQINVASEVSENHELRSKYVWNLLKSCDIRDSSCHTEKIPKIIIQYWSDENEVPEDVLECINSWKKLEKYGFIQLLFNDKSSEEFIKKNYPPHYLEAFHLCNHPAMRADYFRLCYILKNGGIYIDADDVYSGGDIESLLKNNKLKVQPLCYNKTKDIMVETSNFLAPNNYSESNIYYVNNDPLIAPKNHPIILLSLERATNSLLIKNKNNNDIQSLTGPGNLTASIVRYAIEHEDKKEELDFDFIKTWESISFPQWPLKYRNDKRNWRIWDGAKM